MWLRETQYHSLNVLHKFIGTQFSSDSFLHRGQVTQKLKASLPGSIAGGASITLR